MIQVEGLSFSYKTKKVFEDLSFELNGGITGFVGINGAGKSTFVKLCLGLLNPDFGSITINGSEVVKNREIILRDVGILFENPQFPSWVRVYDYLTWVGRVRNLRKSDASNQARILIKKLGLEEKYNEKVSNLSAGLRQRFGIAQAIIGIPKLVFLDEPTANLDLKYRYKVLEMAKSINKEFGTKFVILSHILSDLEKFCDSIIILHGGQIMYQNSIDHLINSFKSKIYLLKNYSTATLEQVQRENDKFKIVNINNSEIEIHLKDNYSQMNLHNFFDQKELTVLPKWSKLEELFFQVTGEDEITIEN